MLDTVSRDTKEEKRGGNALLDSHAKRRDRGWAVGLLGWKRKTDSHTAIDSSLRLVESTYIFNAFPTLLDHFCISGSRQNERGNVKASRAEILKDERKRKREETKCFDKRAQSNQRQGSRLMYS